MHVCKANKVSDMNTEKERKKEKKRDRERKKGGEAGVDEIPA